MTWTIGLERETSPGVYAMLAAVIEGWAVWRFETANGIYVTATKAAEGSPTAIPLGVNQALYNGGLRIDIHVSQTVSAFIHAAHMHQLKAEMREEGERFVTKVPVPFDPMPYDCKRLELFVSSMPGPRSFGKARQDRGTVDLTGLRAAIATAREAAGG